MSICLNMSLCPNIDKDDSFESTLIKIWIFFTLIDARALKSERLAFQSCYILLLWFTDLHIIFNRAHCSCKALWGLFFCGPSFKADAVAVLKRLVNRVCLVSPTWNTKIDLLSKFLKLTIENMKSVIGFTLVVLLAISCNGQFVSLNPCERAIWR